MEFCGDFQGAEDTTKTLLMANLAEVLAVARTMGGGSSWHAGVENMQLRCLVADCIGKVVESMHLGNANSSENRCSSNAWLLSERTRQLVVEVEQHLYLTAPSIDAYMNLATLKRRAEAAALRFSLRRSKYGVQATVPLKDEDHVFADCVGQAHLSGDDENIKTEGTKPVGVDDATKASAAYSLLSIGNCERRGQGKGAKEKVGSPSSSSSVACTSHDESNEDSKVIFLKPCRRVEASASQSNIEIFHRAVAPDYAEESQECVKERPLSLATNPTLKEKLSPLDHSSSRAQTNLSNERLLPTALAAGRLGLSGLSDHDALVFRTGLHPIGERAPKSDPFDKIVIDKRGRGDISDATYEIETERTKTSESDSQRKKRMRVSMTKDAKETRDSAYDDNSNFIILQKRRRLKLLRHASRCGRSGRTCKRRSCPQVRKLCEHIRTCRDDLCSTPHCQSSREIMRHFRQCQADPQRGCECGICGPILKSTRATNGIDKQPLSYSSNGEKDNGNAVSGFSIPNVEGRNQSFRVDGTSGFYRLNSDLWNGVVPVCAFPGSFFL